MKPRIAFQPPNARLWHRILNFLRNEVTRTARSSTTYSPRIDNYRSSFISVGYLFRILDLLTPFVRYVAVLIHYSFFISVCSMRTVPLYTVVNITPSHSIYYSILSRFPVIGVVVASHSSDSHDLYEPRVAPLQNFHSSA